LPTTIKRSFTAGEISPSLQSRADLSVYSTGLNLCKNFFIRAQGGVYSRPGFRIVDNMVVTGQGYDLANSPRLIPFETNRVGPFNDANYMLLFEPGRMYVIRDGAFVLESGVPYFLVTPFTDTNVINRMQFTQSGDIMTITAVFDDGGTAGQHPPQYLVHDPVNDISWSISSIMFGNIVLPPQFPEEPAIIYSINGINIGAQTDISTTTIVGLKQGQLVTIAGIVGTVELNNRSFNIDIINVTTLRLIGEDSSTYTPYISGGLLSGEPTVDNVGTGGGAESKDYFYVVTAVSVQGRESLFDKVIKFTSPELTSTFGAKLNWNDPNFPMTAISYYRVYKSIASNTDIFGWIGDSRTLTFEDFNIAPITSIAPYEERLPFANLNNYPATVGYYQSRHVFANTINDPYTIFMSQTADFESMRISRVSRDDDAVTLTIAAKSVNEIRHIVSLDSLIIMTSGAEWVLGDGRDRVLTPATAGVRVQSYNGSSWLKPIVIDNNVIHLQNNQSKIREFGYILGQGNYLNEELSLMSEHLFKGFEIVSMAFSLAPYRILWCVRSDGVLLGLTHDRNQGVFAWHRHDTDGLFKSVEVIRERDIDSVYVVVARVIQGVTLHYTERLDQREEVNVIDCFYLDSGVTRVPFVTGSPSKPKIEVDGLDHLEGRMVTVLADGYEAGEFLVVAGEIRLNDEAALVQVGLPYLPVIELLDIDLASPSETLKHSSLSVSKVTIEVDMSRGGFVGARQDGDVVTQTTFQEIKPRYDFDGYDPLPLRTYKQEVFIDPQWSKGGGVRIEQRSPLPLTVLSVIPRIDVGG